MPSAAPPFSKDELSQLYYYLHLNRLLEERLTVLYRQGQIVGGLGKSLAGSMGNTVGRAIVRGALGGILRR